MKLPTNAPLTAEQRAALQKILPTLKPGQASWISGYFAGIDALGGDSSPAGSTAQATPVSSAKVALTVLFGSESGNSEGCASQLATAARAAGFNVAVADMADFELGKLSDVTNLLVVVSTWGEGDPPETATAFYEALMGEGAPRLEQLRFSICGLGDTSYVDFCKMGKDFDQRLEALGGKRIFERVDCDVDFEAPFATWSKGAISAFSALSSTDSAGEAEQLEAVPGIIEPDDIVEYSKKNPFPAPVKSRIPLNGPGSQKNTYHLELSLEGSYLSYEAGDVLGVFPENCPEVIKDLVQSAGFTGEEIKEIEGKYLTLLEVLAHYDITALSVNLIKKYAALVHNTDLDTFIAQDAGKGAVQEWMWGREIRDLFVEFKPSQPLEIDPFLGLFRKAPPRLYSIASSHLTHEGEVHLTIAAVMYEGHGRARKGVCSTYLYDRVEKGDTVPVFLHRNKNFKLPENLDTPIIMVGPGTGIAPFRAFVEERVATGASGKNWLFFGDWNFQYDFYYQLEWQEYLQSGALSRLDVAFSRDTDEKVYVQHRMAEQSKELYAWLESGAHFYVCGDASRMAKDVHQTLIDIVSKEGGKTLEEAEAYVAALKKSKRYQRDVY